MTSDRFKILILEDDKLVCELLSLALQDIDAETCFYNTCSEARKHAYSQWPDLAIVDIGLPDGDGREYARSFLANAKAPAPVPTIFLTGRNDPNSRVDSFKVNAIDYITKPFSVLEFTLKISNLIEVLGTKKKREEQETAAQIAAPNSRHGSDLLQSVYSLCEENCSRFNYSISDAAETLNVSTRTLQRRLRKECDKSFSEILTEIRMAKASSLLRQSYPPKDVARMCGYKHAENFTTAFRKAMDYTPREYIKETSI